MRPMLGFLKSSWSPELLDFRLFKLLYHSLLILFGNLTKMTVTRLLVENRQKRNYLVYWFLDFLDQKDYFENVELFFSIDKDRFDQLLWVKCLVKVSGVWRALVVFTRTLDSSTVGPSSSTLLQKRWTIEIISSHLG